LTYIFDSFELDERSFCLMQDGERVPLEPKSLRVLLLLVQSEGQLLEKETILGAVWKDTFVEETTLTRAIALLRKQLGDDPRRPKFIETIPTLGYRFIAPVEVRARKERSTAEASPQVFLLTPVDTPPALDSNPASEVVIPSEARSAQSKDLRLDSAKPPRAPAKRIAWIAAGVLLLLTAAATLRFTLPRTKALTAKDTIVLADFTNTTGDAVFDDTLRQGMTVQLEQSPFLSLVSDERIQQTLALMKQPADARLTPALGREVCQRTGSAAVLDGSIASLGSQYVLGLRALNCRSGEVMDAEQVQVPRKEDVLNALSQVASNFRGRIGESLASVKEHDTPLIEATTPSLEALKAYSTAWKVTTTVGSSAGVPLLKRAIEIDPKFAMAHAMLGRVYGDIGESALAAESTRKAYELRDRSSDNEKFFIVASYDNVVTGDLEKGQQICETWAQTYPRDVNAVGFLSGMIYPVLGNYQKAVEAAKRSVEDDPDASFTYNNLAMAHVALGQLKEGEDTLQRAADHGLARPDFLVDLYLIAFLKGDKAGMERGASQTVNDPEGEEDGAAQEAMALAYAGRLQAATAKSEHAVNLAKQSGQRERAAEFEAAAALREAFFGNEDAARRDAAVATALSGGRDALYGAAFALALAGDAAKAQTLADDLEKRFPEDTEVKTNYAPGIRALLALRRNDPAKAVELLQVNVPYELGGPPSGFPAGYGFLYPIYVRGLAYLALHQGAQAAAEFQKILDHPGIVLTDDVGALARLQIARAYAMSGDTAKAKAAYQNFLTLWKDADPGIPILAQAQAEYAKL
jgi:eukaryotic-like serine/threonine-protein kinase